MNFDYFGCERNDIDSISSVVERNVLIRAFCHHHFGTLDLVDLYYRVLNKNAINIFLFILVTFPVLYVCMVQIAEAYLAHNMKHLSKKLQISPNIAAISLMAVAGGAAEIFGSFAHAGHAGGSYTVVGVTMGVYVIGLTLSLSLTIFHAPGIIKMPKYALIKELVFNFIPILVIAAFGYIGEVNYWFVGIFVGMYVVYILVSLGIETIASEYSGAASLDQGHGHAEHADLHGGEPQEHAIMDGHPTQKFEHAKDHSEHAKDHTLPLEAPLESHGHHGAPRHSDAPFLDRFMQTLVEKDAGLFHYLVLTPFNLLTMLTITDTQNPFTDSNLRYIPLFCSSQFFLFVFGILEEHWAYRLLVGGVVCALVLLVDKAVAKQELTETVLDILGIVSMLAWVQLLIIPIMDFIVFLSFYFSISEITLFTILIALGNSIGEIMALIELARGGAGVMAVLSIYSAQFLNVVIAMVINIFVGLQKGQSEFDLFARKFFESQEHAHAKFPLGNLFLLGIMGMVVTMLLFHVVFYARNNFTLHKAFGYAMFACYAAYFVIAIAFSIFESNVNS